MNTYKVGASATTPIKLSVDVTTRGFADTRAFLTDTELVAIGPSVGDSTNASGDIAPTIIGNAADIAGRYLSITTHIRITGTDIIARQLEYTRIKMLYIIDNGADGHKEFNNPDTMIDLNGDYTKIEITKDILLTSI